MDPHGTVVVTGAHGFLGRGACRALAAAGLPVEEVVRGTEGPLDARLRGARALVHLAAARPTRFDAEGVEALAAANLALDREVFEAAAAARVPVVYASGCSVYGSRALEPLTEDAPCAPLGPYPAAKLAAEGLGRTLATGAGSRFVALRISAPYGPGQSAPTVLRRFVDAAIAGEPLRLFGDGSREQDFVHLDDVSRAIERAVARPVDGIVHVVSGTPTPMRALASAVAEAVHRVAPDRHVRIESAGQPDPQQGLTARYDTRRLRAWLGVEAQVPLVEGLVGVVRDALARRAPS